MEKLYFEPTTKSSIQSLCGELHPNKGIIIRGKPADLENLSCLVLGEEDSPITPSFTWDDVETRLTELQEQWINEEYARNRQAEYPTIAELTVALYDTDDKSAVEAKRAAVKLKYPKPE